MAENQIDLLQTLINAAEKSANIARVCRSNEELLALLIQEKTGTEANARFVHDFKTLADVLIQETIKHDVGLLFPSMLSNIRGEESANFTNALGESVTIFVGENSQQTAKCLAAVLHNHAGAAEILAEEVHRKVYFNDEIQLGEMPKLPADFNYANLGIWIDPIDATAQYIAGETVFSNFPGITTSGLDCVTVLIGVYELSTGIPVIGVIAQPFKNKINTAYKSNIYWGVSLPKLQANNCACLDSPNDDHQVRNLRCIFSTSEQAEILHLMQTLGYEFVFSAGAGHKALKVITGEADAYILSKGSTFLWDTCAPQAILRSVGGDIFDLKKSSAAEKAISLKYTFSKENTGENVGNWKCNEGGLLAVRHVRLVDEILEKIKNSNK